MTSLIGCHSTLFCTSSIVPLAKELMFPQNVGASAVPALPRSLPAFVAVSWGISQNSIFKAQPGRGNCGAALCSMGYIGWDHVLYLTLSVYHLGRVRAWSGLSLTTSCPPAKLRSTGISVPKYHRSRGSLCQLPFARGTCFKKPPL